MRRAPQALPGGQHWNWGDLEPSISGTAKIHHGKPKTMDDVAWLLNLERMFHWRSQCQARAIFFCRCYRPRAWWYLLHRLGKAWCPLSSSRKCGALGITVANRYINIQLNQYSTKYQSPHACTLGDSKIGTQMHLHTASFSLQIYRFQIGKGFNRAWPVVARDHASISLASAGLQTNASDLLFMSLE